MDPQSLDLQGFSEARVEMKVAPFRALTPEAFYFRFSNAHCRNEGRPFQGIDTSSFITKTSHIIYVEMKVAPFRALTLFLSVLSYALSFCRNEGRPFQGISRSLHALILI